MWGSRGRGQTDYITYPSRVRCANTICTILVSMWTGSGVSADGWSWVSTLMFGQIVPLVGQKASQPEGSLSVAFKGNGRRP